MSDNVPMPKEFYKAILNAVRSSFGGVANLSNLSAYEQESNAGFAWYWNIDGGTTNDKTYQLMNTATAYNKDTESIKASATSTTNTALAIYRALEYRLSTLDEAAVNKAQVTSSNEGNNVVVAWNTANFPQITSSDMKEAGVSNQASFVTYYAFTKWCAKDKPVTWDQFSNARDVLSLFPNRPSNADSVIMSLTPYVGAMSGVSATLQLIQNGNWLKNKLIASIQEPTEKNGAITTKNIISGSTELLPAWNVQETTKALQNILDGGDVVTVKMSATKSDSTTVKVSINGGIDLIAPINFIFFFGGGGSASYNSFSTEGSGSSVDIELTYTGAGVAHFDPMKFDQASLKGWYEQKVIAEAYANRNVTGSDRPAQSGFVLSGLSPAYVFGSKGNAGYINAIVFSNPPSVKMTYKTGNYSTFKSHFKEESSWGIGLFGISLFGGSQTYEKAIIKEESASGGFSISFQPKKITSSGVAAGGQFATILAVNPEWMGEAS